MLVRHETYAFSNSLHPFISALRCAGVRLSYAAVVSHYIAGKTCLPAMLVVVGMKLVDEESRVAEVSRLTCKAIRRELAGKVVDDDFWSSAEMCIYG